MAGIRVLERGFKEYQEKNGQKKRDGVWLTFGELG